MDSDNISIPRLSTIRYQNFLGYGGVPAMHQSGQRKLQLYGNKKPRLATGKSVLRIYSLLNADLDTQTQCQKLWRKDPFGVETSAFAEENLGRANFGNPIEGILKLNSSDIDFTASKIMKPAAPTITTANRVVLRSMRKLLERPLKASTIRNRERVKLSN